MIKRQDLLAEFAYAIGTTQGLMRAIETDPAYFEYILNNIPDPGSWNKLSQALEEVSKMFYKNVLKLKDEKSHTDLYALDDKFLGI